MIETKESRLEFEKRREKAKAALRSALRGELPFEQILPVPVLAEPTKADTEGRKVVGGCGGEVRESTTLRQDNPARDNSRGGQKFDRVAYQREYMRKRRAEKRKRETE